VPVTEGNHRPTDFSHEEAPIADSGWLRADAVDVRVRVHFAQLCASRGKMFLISVGPCILAMQLKGRCGVPPTAVSSSSG
jgi:hypothetical protein